MHGGILNYYEINTFEKNVDLGSPYFTEIGNLLIAIPGKNIPDR